MRAGSDEARRRDDPRARVLPLLRRRPGDAASDAERGTCSRGALERRARAADRRVRGRVAQGRRLRRLRDLSRRRRKCGARRSRGPRARRNAPSETRAFPARQATAPGRVMRDRARSSIGIALASAGLVLGCGPSRAPPPVAAPPIVASTEPASAAPRPELPTGPTVNVRLTHSAADAWTADYALPEPVQALAFVRPRFPRDAWHV